VTKRPSHAARLTSEKERGATMVEFALIAVVLFSLIFGIIEGGFAVRARNTINNAVDDAARRGAVAGSNSNADYLILNQLFQRGAASAATVQWVVVYKGDKGSADLPASCTSVDGETPPTSQFGQCNVYVPGQFDADEGAFGCPGYGFQWCPDTRTTSGDLEFIGVYVQAKYEPIIDQIFVDLSFDVSANSLQVIETSGEL